MNKQNMEKWLVDLETTDEPQTHYMLHDEFGYCCLGRLCKVALANGVKMRIENVEDGNYVPHVRYDGRASDPPQVVLDWIGMEPSGDMIDSCITWNDHDDKSFPEIAQNIREIYLTGD